MGDEKKCTSAGKGDGDSEEKSNDQGPLAMDVKIKSEPGAAEVDRTIVKSRARRSHNLHELHAQVFGNDMLRENILRSVIFPFANKPNVINRKCLGNLRLVQKSWLRTVTTCLKKSKEPVFLLTLNKDNSVEGTPYCNEHGKLLDTFNTCLSSAVGYDPGEIPTFSLRLLPDFFRRENYESLTQCLIQLGDGLTELDLSFPVNSSMTFVFPRFTLPKLNRLAVQFSDQRLLDNSSPQQLQNNGHTVYPLQTILNATSLLMDLQFKYTTSDMFIPFGFEYLTLPKTLIGVFLDCPMKNQDLEILLKNDLPNLSHLRLFGTVNTFAEGLVHRVLSKYRTTLRTLNLRGNHYHGRIRSTTLFRLPLMEKLETITVTSQVWELEEDIDNPTQVDLSLPALREIRMLYQPETLFKKWAAKSKYNSVTKLFVGLINQNPNPSGYNTMLEHPLNFNLERMQILNLAFPNVTCLEVTVCGTQTCGLKYLFMEMRKLVKLAITVKGNMEQLHPVHWDALLIGFPPDVLYTMKRHPDFWSEVNIGVNGKYPSIRKLTELRSLALVESCAPSTSMDSSQNFPFISDMSFHFAFLKMTNLKHILLSGRFKVSAQLMEQWRKEKGTNIHTVNSRFV